MEQACNSCTFGQKATLFAPVVAWVAMALVAHFSTHFECPTFLYAFSINTGFLISNGAILQVLHILAKATLLAPVVAWVAFFGFGRTFPYAFRVSHISVRIFEYPMFFYLKNGASLQVFHILTKATLLALAVAWVAVGLVVHFNTQFEYPLFLYAFSDLPNSSISKWRKLAGLAHSEKNKAARTRCRLGRDGFGRKFAILMSPAGGIVTSLNTEIEYAALLFDVARRRDRCSS